MASDQRTGVFNRKDKDGNSVDEDSTSFSATTKLNERMDVATGMNDKVRFSRDLKILRSEKLRQLKVRGTCNPNMKAKLWAARLQDEVFGTDAINLPEPTPSEQEELNGNSKLAPRVQCKRKDGYTIVGNDVESLFPSLLDIESARIAREAVLASDLTIENLNYEVALKYLLVAGGSSHIREIGLHHIAPKWIGKRQDLLTIGGDSLNEDSKWTKLKRELTEAEKRKVLSRVVETAVLVCMSSHVYSFDGDLYIQ